MWVSYPNDLKNQNSQKVGGCLFKLLLPKLLRFYRALQAFFLETPAYFLFGYASPKAS